MTNRQRGHHTTGRLVLRSSSLVFAAYFAWCLVLGVGIWMYDVPELSSPVDAVVVLGARVYGDEPSPVFGERIGHAVELVIEGWAGALLCTGGADEGTVPEGDVARRTAVEAGIPSDLVFAEDLSRSTYENLIEARRMAQEQGVSSLAIVSDPLHMRRVMTMARHLGLDAVPSPTPTTRIRSIGRRLVFACREAFALSVFLTLRAFGLRAD